jgi:hypothetical protein
MALLGMLIVFGTMEVEKINAIFNGLTGLCKVIPFEKITDVLIRYYENRKG